MESVSYTVELFCSETNKSKHRTIVFPEGAPPAIVASVKERIEEELSIPVSVQTIKYEGHPLSDDTNLEIMKIRPGDTFHVTYLSEGDCKEILHTVKWFKLVRDGLQAEAPSKTKPMSGELNSLIQLGFHQGLIDNLTYNYFMPWQDPRKYTNKLYMVQCRGLETIMAIYALLQCNSWCDCLLLQKKLENGILGALWNLAETFDLRKLIISHDGLGMCIKSLLRQTLMKGSRVIDQTDRSSSDVLESTIGNAMGLLSK